MEWYHNQRSETPISRYAASAPGGLLRVLPDELDRVLVRAHGAVGAHAPEQALLGPGRGHVRLDGGLDAGVVDLRGRTEGGPRTMKTERLSMSHSNAQNTRRAPKNILKHKKVIFYIICAH